MPAQLHVGIQDLRRDSGDHRVCPDPGGLRELFAMSAPCCSQKSRRHAGLRHRFFRLVPSAERPRRILSAKSGRNLGSPL